MTSNTSLPQRIRTALTTHTAIPAVNDCIGVIHRDNTVFLIHDTGHATKVRVSTDANKPVTIHSIVTLTTTRPDRITPADDVYAYGTVTRIVHAPGRETIVY